MSKLTKLFWIGLITAAIGCITVSSSIGNRLEQNFGVSLLYKLRGPTTPPPNVAMVYIDGNSAIQLGLPEELKYWPRSVHACILKKLMAAGASVVVFDIAFLEPKPTATHPEEICPEIIIGSNADNAFINAVKKFGDVILLERLEQANYRVFDQSLPTTLTNKPFDKLSEAAIATGPFVLPDATLRLDYFWNYLCHQEPVNSEGECQKKIATLPMLALHHYNTEKAQKQTINETDSAPFSQILNFYGPPRTIPCRSYQSILRPLLRDEACADVDFSKKVVFVGIAEYDRPAQSDSFYTVYSGNDGIDIVGLEVLATAFANLHTGASLNNLGIVYKLLIVSFFGIILGLLTRIFSPIIAIGIGVIISCIYLIVAHIAFAEHYLILPIITPLLIQVPVAIILASFIHFRYEKIRREALQQITGYYIPEGDNDQSIYTLPPTGRVLGVCLATDMENSTTLAEMLGSKKFEQLMGSYYEAIATIIKKHDGILLDIAGDGTMSAWIINDQESDARIKACTAALEIIAVQEHLTTRLGSSIQTRIGLHAGEFRLNFIRVGVRYFYKGTGDTLNIASRIEQLNKKLNTRILASDSVIESTDQISLKHHGLFTIRGLSKKIKILEVLE